MILQIWPCGGPIILKTDNERDLRVIRCEARPAAVLIVLTTRFRRGRPIFLRLTHIPHSRLAVHE